MHGSYFATTTNFKKKDSLFTFIDFLRMFVYLFLFISFFQVGMLGIGSSAGAQALLEHEVITLHHWFTPEQMANFMFLCRLFPGSTGFNTAVVSGCVAASPLGFWGCVCAAFTSVAGLVIPSFLWTTLYAKLQEQRKYRSFYECVMVVLRPLIPGLIASAAIIMMRADSFGSPTTTPWEFLVSVFLFVATLVGVMVYRFNALFMIFLCGIAGWILL